MMWRFLQKLVKSMETQGEMNPTRAESTAALDPGVDDTESRDRLAAMIYPELKRIARAHMSRERPDHTLQATALVNEVYLHMLQGAARTWTSRSHFLYAASQAMHRL